MFLSNGVLLCNVLRHTLQGEEISIFVPAKEAFNAALAGPVQLIHYHRVLEVNHVFVLGRDAIKDLDDEYGTGLR